MKRDDVFKVAFHDKTPTMRELLDAHRQICYVIADADDTTSGGSADLDYAHDAREHIETKISDQLAAATDKIAVLEKTLEEDETWEGKYKIQLPFERKVKEQWRLRAEKAESTITELRKERSAYRKGMFRNANARTKLLESDNIVDDQQATIAGLVEALAQAVTFANNKICGYMDGKEEEKKKLGLPYCHDVGQRIADLTAKALATVGQTNDTVGGEE